ncbi:hypothetical protein [Caryophanon latum]|uniref:Uncharacterized protein n=1 Tax=Caryophanon latum TaxID=33977 RepID=A0A1C0YUV5_9BACL|nr:hypothetical protein [Caryophanon latum]OCS90966.1 hypothetical protein A6K76_10360 [Caryophanon latum]
MLIDKQIYNEAVIWLLQKYPHYLIEEVSEKTENYVGFEAVVQVNVERKIDVIEKFILKLLQLPLTNRKTIELINDILNIGTVFVKSYIAKLQSYNAIQEQDFEYVITTTGEQLLEKGIIDIEMNENTYQFVYNLDTQQILSSQAIKQLTKVHTNEHFVTERQFLTLVQQFDQNVVNNLKVKSLQQQAYISDVSYEVIAINRSTRQRELLVINENGDILSTVLHDVQTSLALSQIEQQHSKSTGQVITVTTETVSYELSQAKHNITLAFKNLNIETFSLLDMFFVRKTRVPTTVFYENTNVVNDKGTQRDIRQYYTIKTTGKRPICFIHSEVAFDCIIIDQTSLFYLENNQWYYDGDYNNWFEKKEGTLQLFTEQLHAEKDEVLWYPLLRGIFTFKPNMNELLAIVQKAKKSKPINFAHRFEKLLVSYQIDDEILRSELTHWKQNYYKNKKARA